jgi:competence protein ComEA
MDRDPVVAAFERLAPAARVPVAARFRIGVGAAVVLLIVALGTAVIVSAVGQQSGHEVVTPGSAAPSAPSGSGLSGSGLSGSASSGATVSGTASPGSAGGPVILVHVLGAVRRPGLFELGTGARVMDAVAAAGGLTETADPAGANLARRLSDGEQLYLPQLGEAQPGAPPGAGGAAANGAGPAALVNLNTATLAELDTLPRIGPAMAQRIIDYRAANGPFGSVDDLRNVTGIGDKTFEALTALITI